MGRKLRNSAPAETASLIEIGSQLRQIRKNLGLTVAGTAAAAGISRVTLHRIEKGEPSVSFGAIVAVADALGTPLLLGTDRGTLPPTEIVVSEYPGLRSLAWQLADGAKLTPREAWSTYTRNWRHLKPESLSAAESQLIERLRTLFEGSARV